MHFNRIPFYFFFFFVPFISINYLLNQFIIFIYFYRIRRISHIAYHFNLPHIHHIYFCVERICRVYRQFDYFWFSFPFWRQSETNASLKTNTKQSIQSAMLTFHNDLSRQKFHLFGNPILQRFPFPTDPN